MAINALINRKLVSLLSPYLIHDPTLDLNLGFLSSNGLAQNLVFDSDILSSEVFSEPNRFVFKEVKVESFGVEVSYWSADTFVIQVRGLHVVLEATEDRPLGAKSMTNNSALEERKRILTEIDPEDSALHDVLQNLSEIDSSKNQRTSFLDVLIEHCQLQIHDISVHVKFPIANDSYGISFGIKQLNLGSVGSNRCFMRSLFGVFTSSSKELVLSLDVKGFEVWLKKNDADSCLISSVDFSAHMKFNNLKLVGCNIEVPELLFSFNPAKLGVLFVVYALLCNISNQARNGRHLWNIAADRIGTLTRFSLCTLVLMVCIWIQYVNMYEDLLLLVGYPGEKAMNISTVKISGDDKFSASVKKKWKKLCEFEKKLPAEAILRARRIARYRAELERENRENHYSEVLVHYNFNFYQRILLLISLVWKIISKFFFVLVIWRKNPKSGGSSVVSEDSSAQGCFHISVGSISAAISPLNYAQSHLHGFKSSDLGISSLDLQQICVSVDELIILHTVGVCEQNFKVSCSQMKVISSSLNDDDLQNTKDPKRYLNKETVDGERIVLKTQPASTLYVPNATAESSSSVFQDLFDEVWSNWKTCCTEFKNSGIQYCDTPWMFCETKKSVTDKRLKNVGSGFWKGSLMLGKVFIFLDYSTISSFCLVLGQIQTVYLLSQGNKSDVILPTPVTEDISQLLTWDEKCKSHVVEAEKMLLKIVPQKHIQMCIYIAGPLIRLPLRKDLFYSQYINEKKIAGQDENHLVLSICDLELAVLPAKEQKKINIPRFGSEKYKSQENISTETYAKACGLEAFIENSAENKKYHIVLLNPLSIKFLSSRQNVYSLDSAVIAISATWQAVAAGISVLLFMDELFVISKVLIDIFSPISHTIYSSSSFTGARSQVLVRQEPFIGTPVRRTENVPSTYTKAKFIFNGTFEISSMEIILQNSRKGNTRENYGVIYDQISRKKMVINDLPDYGTILIAHKMSLGISLKEKEVQMNADLFDFCSLIFRDQSDIWTTMDHFQVRDAINSLSSLCEISVSHFNFALRLSNLYCSGIEIEEASTHWLVMNFTSNEIYLTGLSVKEILIDTHKSNKLNSSVVFGRDFQTIGCQIKGGSFFMETTALALFVKCFASYHHFIRNLVPVQPQHMVTGVAEDIVVQNRDQQVTWKQLEELKIDFSQFFFTLVAADKNGGFREVQFGADFLLNLDNENRKFSFDLSQLSILSQTLSKAVEQKSSEIQIPHFFTSWSSGQSSEILLEDQTLDNSMPELLNLGRQNYILKRLGVSVTVERPIIEESDRSQGLDQGWIGSGAILGLDMTISLQEMQMILSALESLPAFSSEQTVNNVGDGYQESDRSLIGMPPDGAIVAIQDVDQHTYMSIDGIEGKHSLVGTIHYSLVGERALFRVKYQNQKRWGSSALWFFLISLHAKNSSGEPLRLNYRKGSGFLDISSASDESEALWTTIPFNSKNEELETKPESYNFSGKNTFYFVNKKTDQAVAFVEEVPEFVNKPGNLFKWKVFHDFSPYENFPQIDITVEKVIVTIVHELPDTKETFPLLRASICTTEFVVHFQLSKVRAMGRLSFVLQIFDGQSNLWKEFVDPVELCVFYRSRFQVLDSRIGPHTVSASFYARMKKFGVAITELSLDTLLFVIGTLDLAGPFAIKNSKILSNSCKVQNYCGLDLLCHFYDNQDTSVASKQTSTIFLRNLGSMHQIPEASKFSIQLSQRGSYLTSPINLSLLEAGSLAWRTRIVSTRDSKTYPGPFLIIDVTRESEEGLSISVSPLLRIYNETKFSMELSFRRPQQEATKAAPVILKSGETVDESVAAFDAINLSGDLRKALMSLSVGNFLLSFRPDVMDDLTSSKRPISVEWSLDLKGGKTVKISGVFDKLSYKVRKAFSVKPLKVSFSTAHCSLKYEDGQVANLHFLIQVVIREIPVILPDNFGDATQNRDSPVAVKEQKEIYILPTFRIMNLLQVEIHVLLTDSDPGATIGVGNIGNEANISSGSSVDLYADPAAMFFIVTLTEFNSSCKPVNSGDCVRKLQKKREDVAFLDIDLIFGGGKYFASLRLSRGNRGVMEVTVYTPYTLRNDTDLSLLCFASNRKPFSREDTERLKFTIPPEDGSLLPPKSTKSWFMKNNKVRLKLVEKQASEVLLDLDSLSGLAEIGLEAEGISGAKHIMKLGLSLGPLGSKADISQIVTMVPRYVVSNESVESIVIRQYDVEDDQEGVIEIPSKQKSALRLRARTTKKEINVFEKLVYKHRNTYDDSSTFIQFKRNKAGLGWSGPVCVASLGRFFLKFRKYDNTTLNRSSIPEFAAVHVVEENSTLVSRFYKPPDVNLPYRIENNLHQTSITYFQKDSFDPEILGPGNKVDYVWDDLTRPRRLIVQIDDLNLRREINLDKVRGWKRFYRASQQRGLGSRLPLDKKSDDSRETNLNKPFGQQLEIFGYEIYADGATRVLRFSDFRASFKRNALCPSKRVRIKISSIALNLLENAEREMDATEAQVNTAIVVGRIENVSLIFVLSDNHIYNKMTVQSLSVDQKWVGTPFAAMLRRHQSDSNSMNGDILHIVFVILSSSSSVRQIKYSSVVLQPISVNIDEETLMRLVPFWRTSLSESTTPSRQYYFDHFEIHPVKIVANFLPGDSISSYSSPQETLRTLLHSVIKIPAIKSKTIELNGVLVTHALITIKELFFKCAQHYSWYAMRAIYIAKGSPLLPPAFASIFDDLASSSLDAFFDPSTGLINVPGLTIGTFKLLSKCIDGKGFSGTKRYLGDLGKTMKTAGSNILFAAVTEISDSILKGAEASGVNGMVSGFRQGVLKLAMEPSVLGAAFMEGGPDRKIMLDRSPGIDELYIEGYLQAMLDTTYKQEYLRVRVVDNQVFLKNMPPNSSLIEEIMDRVKSFLLSKALLKGDQSISQPLRHLRGQTEWKIGPTVVTLCEHLFVSFAIRFLRKRTGKFIVDMNLKEKFTRNDEKAIVPASSTKDKPKMNFSWKWGIGKFMFSGVLAYIDGRLCRRIPNPVVRRIVSGFILSFLDTDDA